MRRFTLALAVIFVLSLIAGGRSSENDYGLPALHLIKMATLSPAYSCRSPEEFSQGYQETALFLSAYSKRRNSPDLLFNGACRSEDYFQVSTAGDDMALIADLGANVPLEDVSVRRALDRSSQFVKSAKVALNHTYVVLINKSEIRGLFAFNVTEHVPNLKVGLRYAVKSYQVRPDLRIESPGFDWERRNGSE